MAVSDSRQSSLSPHQNLASPNNWLQQGNDAEVRAEPGEVLSPSQVLLK